MTSLQKSPRLKQFISRCLEPPTDGTPVIDKNVRYDIHWEMRKRWNEAKAAYDFMSATHVNTPHNSPSCEKNWKNARDALNFVFQTPAPTLKELEWKKRRRDKMTDPSKVNPFIARDEQFHAIWSAHKI